MSRFPSYASPTLLPPRPGTHPHRLCRSVVIGPRSPCRQPSDHVLCRNLLGDGTRGATRALDAMGRVEVLPPEEQRWVSRRVETVRVTGAAVVLGRTIRLRGGQTSSIRQT